MHPKAYLDMASIEENHWWYKGRREIINYLIKSLDLPTNASLLEIGCGTGGNLKMLAQHGHVTAVEMSDIARAIADKNNSQYVDIHAGWLPNNIPNFDTKFDLICLFDVLEHIENEELSLIKLKSLLSDNGKILITVPAYQWLWGKHDEYHHHYRRYTIKRLQSSISSAGLKSHRASYFNTFLFPIAAIIRLLENFINMPTPKKLKLNNNYLNRLLIRIFSSEVKLLSIKNLAYGLSIFFIASLAEND